MLLEAINSVSLIFLATEFLLVENSCWNDSSPRHKTSFVHHLRAIFASQHSRPIQYIFPTVLLINLLIYFHATGAALEEWIHNTIGKTHFHIPRILVAISSFLLALYWDCRQKCKPQSSSVVAAASPPWSNRCFLQLLVQSFCQLLPVYPFLAVIISFGFLLIITAFERLHLPLQILNMPIYYGTLYGYVLCSAPLKFFISCCSKSCIESSTSW